MKTIRIQTGIASDGPISGVAQVHAHVDGEWAAHPAHHGPGWAVTHVPSGLALNEIAGGIEPIEALEIARVLRERVPHVDAVTSPAGRTVASRDDADIILATVAELLAEGFVP